jgi:SanA protein
MTKLYIILRQRNPNMFSHRPDRQKVKKWVKLLAAVMVIGLFVTVLTINLFIVDSTKKYIFHQVSDLPQREFGLVRGTERLRPDGSANVHFFNRTEAAAGVYFSGKVNRLLISGNRNNRGFNEVADIESKLSAESVPINAMILDFDGTTTWESARRAKEIYHLQKVTIITDSFHAPRSIFLCKHFGIDAVAFCHGKEPVGFWPVRSRVREWLACVKAVFEVLLDRKNYQNG